MLARNSLISMMASIVPVVVTIVTLPFLLNAIGLERYGALALCWLILIYVGQADWGLGKATTHWVARTSAQDPDAARGIMASGIATALIVGSAMAALAGVISWLFFAKFFDVDPALRTELLDSVWLIAAATLATSILQVMYGALAGRERFAAASLAMMISNASLPLLALATALLIDPGLEALMMASLAGRLLGVLVAGSDIWMSQFRKQQIRLQFSDSRKLLKFGFWIMSASFTAPILITIDRMIIGSKLGPAAVAAYTIPYQIVSRLQLVPQSLMNVLFPRLSVADQETARKTSFFYAVTISAMFLPIIVGLIFVLEPLLQLWLGSKLDDRSTLVGIVLLCAFLFAAIAQSTAVFLQSQNDGKFVAAFQFGEILPYVGLLTYAVAQGGLLGVAIVFLVRRVIETICFVARSNYGNIRFWVTQIPAGLAIASALFVEAQSDTLLSRIGAGTLIAIIAFVGAVFAAPSELRSLLTAQMQSRMPVFLRR